MCVRGQSLPALWNFLTMWSGYPFSNISFAHKSGFFRLLLIKGFKGRLSAAFFYKYYIQTYCNTISTWLNATHCCFYLEILLDLCRIYDTTNRTLKQPVIVKATALVLLLLWRANVDDKIRFQQNLICGYIWQPQQRKEVLRIKYPAYLVRSHSVKLFLAAYNICYHHRGMKNRTSGNCEKPDEMWHKVGSYTAWF